MLVTTNVKLELERTATAFLRDLDTQAGHACDCDTRRHKKHMGSVRGPTIPFNGVQ